MAPCLLTERRFHRHLMTSLIGQVLVVTWALATGDIAVAPATVLVASSLLLAAHLSWVRQRHADRSRPEPEVPGSRTP